MPRRGRVIVIPTLILPALSPIASATPAKAATEARSRIHQLPEHEFRGLARVWWKRNGSLAWEVPEFPLEGVGTAESAKEDDDNPLHTPEDSTANYRKRSSIST